MRISACFIVVFLAAQLALAQTYVSGPYVTHPGLGPVANSDASAITAPTTIFGFGVQIVGSTDNRVADDFTVPCGEFWVISSIKVFGYQTGSTVPTSTLTQANYRIWSGQPGSPGAAILQDFSTANQLQSSTFTNCYRVNAVGSTDSTRPIYDVVMNGNNIQLPPGTYWVDYQLAGSLASGPWAPPISIVGQPITGNAWQYVGTVGTPGTWVPATSVQQWQGFPFEINYTMGSIPCWTFAFSQPGPNGPLTLADSGGAAGNLFFNAITLNQGTFPYGPFFGLDMSLGEILTEIAGGPPFSGILDVTGSYTLTIPGFIPSGITVYATGIQGNYAGLLEATPPFSYTTQ